LLAACLTVGLMLAAGEAWAAAPRDAQLQDLQAIRDGYVQKSLAFTPRGRIKAHQLVDRLEARAGSLSDAQRPWPTTAMTPSTSAMAAGFRRGGPRCGCCGFPTRS
jgi:hypothetical protein